MAAKLSIEDQIGRVADALFSQAKALRDAAKAAETQVEISKALLMTQIQMLQQSRQLEAQLEKSLRDSGVLTDWQPPPGSKPN